ncbi:hypothetical protein [Bacillus seohaeanensis]|uniref:BppU N-terminal domain-containing protein n=1 Tax=Bacillus seohaeanensis TaxID=284580 RepID=A0ABW5RTA6_9BACI
MKTVNKKTVTIDLRQSTVIPLPQFIQNDTNILEFIVKDNRIDADLSNIGRIVVNYKRPDNHIVSRLLTPVNNTVSYEIGNEEMEVAGRGKLEIQFFSLDNLERISTKKLEVRIHENIGSSAIQEDDEDLTILQELFIEVGSVSDYAQEQGDYAKLQGNYAKTQGDYAKTEAQNVSSVATDVSDAEELRVTAENERVTSENTRGINESTRIDNENVRQSNETDRKNAESTRETNEQIRQTQEQQRQTNTAQAISDVETATANANEAANESQTLVDTYIHLGDYSSTTTYVVNNEVRYNGSTWRCIQDCTGVTPVEGVNWTLVAKRGMDGTGSVSSVNGSSPDQTGNVTIETFSGDYNDLINKPNIPTSPDDIGAATTQSVTDVDNKIGLLSDDVGAVDQRVTDHLNEYMPHDDELNEYASDQDEKGVYRVVDFKRPDGTLHLKSTLSNPDAQGKYQTCTLQFYEADGVTVALTKTWTFTLGTDGSFSAKEVA